MSYGLEAIDRIATEGISGVGLVALGAVLVGLVILITYGVTGRK